MDKPLVEGIKIYSTSRLCFGLQVKILSFSWSNFLHDYHQIKNDIWLKCPFDQNARPPSWQPYRGTSLRLQDVLPNRSGSLRYPAHPNSTHFWARTFGNTKQPEPLEPKSLPILKMERMLKCVISTLHVHISIRHSQLKTALPSSTRQLTTQSGKGILVLSEVGLKSLNFNNRKGPSSGHTLKNNPKPSMQKCQSQAMLWDQRPLYLKFCATKGP